MAVNTANGRGKNWTQRHSKLKEISRVREWHSKIARRSLLSADVRLRSLGLYCEIMNTDPLGVLESDKIGKLKNEFRSFVGKLDKEGKAGSYISRFKVTLNNWIKFNDIEYKLNTEILNSNKYKKFYGEMVPTQSQLQDIIRNASKHERVSIGLMAFAGFRPQVIGNYDGTDGLTLRDFEGLDIVTMSFKETLSLINVRDSLSKNSNPYFSLIGGEGQKYILEYLKERVEHGELLSQDSPVVTFSERGFGRGATRQRMRTLMISRDIRFAFDRAKLDSRPYTLRRYFMTSLSIGESRSFISHADSLFLAGHNGDIQSTYVHEKGNLNNDKLSQLKHSYGKCLTLLESTNSTFQDVRTEILLAVYKPEELKHIDVGKLTDEEFHELIRKSFTKELSVNGQKFITIKQSEIDKYLSKGYKPNMKLDDGKIVMEFGM